MRDKWSTKEWSRDGDKALRNELMVSIKKLQRKKRKARKKKNE